MCGPQKLWTFIGFPLALSSDTPRADVVFSPTHYVPRFVQIPRVMSVMDLSYLYFPELFKTRDLYQLTHWTKYAIEHVQAICTISEYSKNDIINRYGVKKNTIVVTYPGLSMSGKKQSKSQQERIVQSYGISKHFILSVGTIQPRKNYDRLIAAFALFLKKNKQQFGEIQLVVIGKKGWLVDDILRAPEKNGIAEKVKFLDFIPDEHLPAFYTRALCFALPSLYEGFGLPVLEAMAYGCPVVVSTVSSLPEIAGKAGIYVDPLSVESIRDGLLSAVRQRNLMQGKLRIQQGRARVNEFTWEKAAEKTLSVLLKVADDKKI